MEELEKIIEQSRGKLIKSYLFVRDEREIFYIPFVLFATRYNNYDEYFYAPRTLKQTSFLTISNKLITSLINKCWEVTRVGIPQYFVHEFIDACFSDESKETGEKEIESFEKPQDSKLSKKDFDAISFGNDGYSKSSIKKRAKD